MTTLTEKIEKLDEEAIMKKLVGDWIVREVYMTSERRAILEQITTLVIKEVKKQFITLLAEAVENCDNKINEELCPDVPHCAGNNLTCADCATILKALDIFHEILGKPDKEKD